MRWSSLTRLNERRSTSKCPVSTVCWYTQIALMTIHRIGKKPNAAPSVPASSVWPIGMPYTRTATTMATASEISDATHAVTLHDAEQHEQQQQGYRRDQRTPREGMGNRIENLLVHERTSIVRFVVCVTRVPSQTRST